jgi:hypothetical protein
MDSRDAATCIGDIASESLIGKRASIKTHPEIVGHITCVKIFEQGRSFTFATIIDGKPESWDCDSFQLELLDG